MKKAVSLALALLIIASLCGAGYSENIVGVEKVNVETYPFKGSGNDLPTVGQSVSTFYAGTITAGISVTGVSLVDDSGATCSGTVENKNYTLNVAIVSNASNYVFTPSTKAYINGVAASISPSADGLSAMLSRYIKPNVVDPVIYKNPGDENHDKNSLFSFTASASQVFTSFQWYIMSTYGEKFTPEELASAYPGVTCSVKDVGGGVVRINIGNPYDEMTGWLVYCVFTGASGTPVTTSKATMTIKGAEAGTYRPSPSIEIVSTPEGTTVDGITVPEGVTIVETPTPQITIIETPEPAAETPQPQEPATDTVDTGKTEETAAGQNLTEKVKGFFTPKVLSILKWVGIAAGGILLIALLVLFVQYLADKRKRKRRAKMAGRYKGRH